MLFRSTPTVGIYHRLWGAATHERATGIHRPLRATALCLAPLGRPDDSRWTLALDHCLLWHGEQSRLLAELERATGVPSTQILLAYSHTHSAGLMDLSRRDLPGGELIAPYLDQLTATLTTLVLESRDKLAPAVIDHAVGRCDLAAERDFQIGRAHV